MIFPILLTAVATANLFFGFVVYLRRPRSLLHYCFLLLTIAVAVWGMGIAAFLSPSITRGVIHYINLYYGAALLIATSLYGFVATLQADRNRTVKDSAMILFLPVAYLLFTLFFPETLLTFDGISREVSIHIAAYWIYGIIFSSIFGSACVQLFRFAFLGEAGRRYRYLSVGIGMAGLVGVVFNLIFPAFGNYSFVSVGPVASLFFVVTLAYSILHGKLFDIRRAIARVIGYTAAVFFLSASFGWAVAWLVTVLSLGAEQLQLVIVVVIVILTAVYQRVKQFFDQATERIFFQKPYDTQEAIDRITGLMVQVETVDELLKKVATSLQDYIGADSVTVTLTTNQAAQQVVFTTLKEAGQHATPILTQGFMLAHEKRVLVHDDVTTDAMATELTQNSIAMVSQLRSQTGLVGYLLFGYKRNGSSYTKRDTDFIDIVSDEFALAIQSMQRFQEISAFNAQLKQRINEATAELQVTNRKLQSLDKSKDEFISMASHQLRTPLTAVKGYISMILDGDVGAITGEQRQVLQQAYESSQRMVFLIGDFLNVSRLQTGKFMLEPSDINLSELAKEEVDQLIDTARSREVSITYTKPAARIMVSADENKLRQVMMNFIDNAIFYSGRKGGVVTIHLYKEKDGAVFKVIDTGIGVPKEDQAKLFTKFFRAGNARQQRPDGTGIGLYMAKKVIVAHGGTLIFESQEGKGSTFGFRLPLKDNVEKLDKKPDTASSDGRRNRAKAK